MLLSYSILLFLLSITLKVNCDQGEFTGKRWVVLCSGGRSWVNYAFHANVYHAYHMFRGNGIPDENIIIMHYDDIANNSVNPTPSKVYNDYNKTDVYYGVPKHYTGDDVNPTNFLGVLKGDETLARSGKPVVNSGPDDHIFVYFADHGSPDMIHFPFEFLWGEELNVALQEMHLNKRYSKLVFYLDTCESGSMFYKLLPNNIDVYAVSATSPEQLGTLFSYYWMKNTELNDFGNEITLQQQFEYIYSSANKSNPDIIDETQQAQQYGDLSIAKLPISQFFGKSPKSIRNDILLDNTLNDRVNTRDVPLYMAKIAVDEALNTNEKNRNNPTPGKVFNEVNGSDVYHGVPKHYTGDDVNPTNFLGVLKGDQTLARSGKPVVNSGPDDHIFVFFTDHGSPGSMFNKMLPDNIDAYPKNKHLPTPSQPPQVDSLGVLHCHLYNAFAFINIIITKSDGFYLGMTTVGGTQYPLIANQRTTAP
ncbi:unnamed protein product, partial [Medioppia subpectinata]